MRVSPSYDLLGQAGRSPVVLSVAHAGRAYPADIGTRLKVPLAQTLPLEDRLVDQIIGRNHAIVQRVPRLLIDLNRAETDLDPAIIVGGIVRFPVLSIKARGGLGLVPTRLGAVGELWRAPIEPTELAQRLRDWHRPWHAAVAAALALARGRFQAALLIDVHSMPPIGNGEGAQIIIGSRHATSARKSTVGFVVQWWRERGYRCVAEVPYAGGHIVERHGNPAVGIEALQIEFDRRLYLDNWLSELGKGHATLRASLAEFTEAAARHMSMIAIAAE